MSLLSRVEAALEAALEGGFRRLFTPRVQPVEVARALERTMVDLRVVGPSSVDVPNRFIARLNPADFERLGSFRDTAERDAAAYLERRAREGGFRLIGRIQVRLVADQQVPRSLVRGEAVFDESIGTLFPFAAGDTRRFEPARAPALLIGAEDGQELRVDRQAVKIGRALDNDLVVRDVRVSRHHAVIEWTKEGWIIRDLQSTNGTYAGGRRIDQAPVDPAGELSLGGYRLTLRPG